MVCARIALAKTTVDIEQHSHGINPSFKSSLSKTNDLIVASLATALHPSSALLTQKVNAASLPFSFIALSLAFRLHRTPCQCWHHKPRKARIAINALRCWGHVALSLHRISSLRASRIVPLNYRASAQRSLSLGAGPCIPHRSSSS